MKILRLQLWSLWYIFSHLSLYHHTYFKASETRRNVAIDILDNMLCSYMQYLQWTQDPVDCATSVRFFYDDEFIYICVQRRSAFRYNSVILLSNHVLTAPQPKQHVRSAPLPHVLCLCLGDLQWPHRHVTIRRQYGVPDTTDNGTLSIYNMENIHRSNTAATSSSIQASPPSPQNEEVPRKQRDCNVF